jgi:hypothetical protein
MMNLILRHNFAMIFILPKKIKFWAKKRVRMQIALKIYIFEIKLLYNNGEGLYKSDRFKIILY